MASTLDLAVIGDDGPSYCAAALAARGGLKTAIIVGPKRHRFSDGLCEDLPNDLWRRLELDAVAIDLKPVERLVTLLEKGRRVETFADDRRTEDALSASGASPTDAAAAPLWRDFRDDMRARAEPVGDAAARGSTLFALDAKALHRRAIRCAPARATIEDYFNGSDLSVHLCAHGLAPVGLGDGDPGSARHLAEGLCEDAWPAKPEGAGDGLAKALEAAADAAGVERIAAQDAAFAEKNGRARLAAGDDERGLARALFASPQMALKASYRHASAPHNQAYAELRVDFDEAPDGLAALGRALARIMDDAACADSARSDVVAGRLPARPPISVWREGADRFVLRTAYCPRRFREDGEWRGWTGQDRQAIARVMLDRLEARFPGARVAARDQTLTVIGDEAHLPAPPAHWDNVLVQPRAHGAYAAAARLVDALLPA